MSQKHDLLDKLFDATLRELLNRIEDGTAKPADLNCARQMLRDNGIDAAPEAKPNLIRLADITPEGAFSGPDDTLQ